MNDLDQDEIAKIVDAKIRDHERRVALFSGIIGVSVVLGIFHAIRLNNSLLGQ
jgi:hypothetical protein